MEFAPVRPKHCENCPSYNSNPKMTFRYFQFKKDDSIVIGDNIIHILYLTEGKISINGTAIENHIIPANNFVLLARMQKFTITALKDSEAIIQDVMFPFFVCEQNIFDSTYAPIISKISSNYKFSNLLMREPIVRCIESIIFAIKDGMLCNHLIRMKMIELFLYYKHYYTTEELSNLFFPAFDKRMEFFIKVYGAMHSAKSVKELAEATGYSLSNFKVQFKNFFGVTPYNWMIEQKLERLRSSLQDESKPIKAIVEEFGFSDQSHLNNFCKRYLGGTARNVREEMNKS